MKRNGGIKSAVRENRETPREKPTQTQFHPQRNPHGVTETRFRDPSGGRRAPNRLHHKAYWFNIDYISLAYRTISNVR